MKYIILHEHDSGKPHGVNLKYLQDWSDYEIWINGKRYKVKENCAEIVDLIECKPKRTDEDTLRLMGLFRNKSNP